MANEEQQLTQALRSNDEKAFDTMFRAWYAPLVRYAFSFTEGDQDEAEELVQDAFVKLWGQRDKLEFQNSVKAYLYRMVHNQALNRLRAHRIHDRYTQHQARQMAHEYEPPQDNPELQERFRKVLDALPAQCRHVFELSRFESLKYREIAEHLDISIKTVETHMGKALRILRVELAEYMTLFLTLVQFIPF
ncbi:MAG: RNA polymerase sigma-70 factor [Saprospiraceae bacterium]